MWRPRRLGTIIAERRLRFAAPRRPARTVIVRFGRPVQASRPERGDPWWCPVEITGLGRRSLRPIAGEDSLQALVLALEFVTRILPVEAERIGGHLEWLGEREQLVFANTLSGGLVSSALQNCVEGIADAVDALENGRARRHHARRKVASQLKALIASGGYTSDPRRVAQPSNSTLQRTRARGARPGR